LTSKKLNNQEIDLQIFSHTFVSNFLVTEFSTLTLNLLQCISHSGKIIYSVAFIPGKWTTLETCWVLRRCVYFPMKCQWMCH